MKRRTYVRSILFYALLMAAPGIWGYIGYRVAREVLPPPRPPSRPAVPGPAEPVRPASPDTTRPYVPDFRDPFTRPASWDEKTSMGRKRRVGTPVPAARPPTSLPLALIGVVGETALMRTREGEILFMRRGETRAGLRILEVRTDQVVVRFDRRTLTLLLGTPPLLPASSR